MTFRFIRTIGNYLGSGGWGEEESGMGPSFWLRDWAILGSDMDQALFSCFIPLSGIFCDSSLLSHNFHQTNKTISYPLDLFTSVRSSP